MKARVSDFWWWSDKENSRKLLLLFLGNFYGFFKEVQWDCSPLFMIDQELDQIFFLVLLWFLLDMYSPPPLCFFFGLM